MVSVRFGSGRVEFYRTLDDRQDGVAQTGGGAYILCRSPPLTSSGEVGRWAEALQVNLSPDEPSKIR